MADVTDIADWPLGEQSGGVPTLHIYSRRFSPDTHVDLRRYECQSSE